MNRLPVKSGDEQDAEHRIVDTELMSSLTMQCRYTCACGWFGYRWNEHAEAVGAKPLPPEPRRPGISREEIRRAIYGERSSARRRF